MAIEVVTKDCSALGDADLAEMADFCMPMSGHEVGMLSKQAEEWVLVSRAFDGEALGGFLFSTLERIGGTPAVVIGLATVDRSARRNSVLSALMSEQFHKARMAFPDEDVVVAGRATGIGAFQALAGLSDVRPWPDVRANGEERAWGRRLAKRFGTDSFNDRTMVAADEGRQLVIDHHSDTNGPHDETVGLFAPVTADDGQFLVIWGWAMVEMLEQYA